MQSQTVVNADGSELLTLFSDRLTLIKYKPDGTILASTQLSADLEETDEIVPLHASLT